MISSVVAAVLCVGGGDGQQPPPLEEIVQVSTHRISRALERVRKLRFRAPVPSKFLNREQVQAHVRAYMERDYPATRLREIAAARAAWGYLPRGYDLQAAHLRLFDGGVAAFYDARDKVIIVPAGADPARLPEVLVHELAHGLQDQHLPLDDLVRPDRNDDDQSWAHAAVIVCAYCGYKALDNYSLYAVQVLGMDEVRGAALSTWGSWIRPIAAHLVHAQHLDLSLIHI